MLTTNVVLQPKAPDAVVRGLSRVLGICSDGRPVLLELRKKLRAPYRVPLEALQNQLQAGQVVVAARFTVKWLYRSEEDFKGLPRTKSGYDKRVEAMKPVLAQGTALFDPTTRQIALQLAAKDCGMSVKQLRRLLFWYWACGQSLLALVPRYSLRGCHTDHVQQPGTAKRGRKRQEPLPPARVTGHAEMAVTGAVAEQVERHCREHYRPGKTTLRRCYDQYLAAYHTEEWLYDNGEPKPLFDYAKQAPSFRQYQYIAAKANRDGELERKALGAKAYRKRYGVRISRARDRVEGPCEIFQLDWSVIQLPIRSVFNRNVCIGTAIVYLLIDLWSTAIVGNYVALEDKPTWASARRAILNAISDKIAACAEVGIAIGPEDYPCHHLPQHFIGDRGELAGDGSLVLSGGLFANLGFAASGESNHKAAVERAIRTLKWGPMASLPGHWHKNENFREYDPRAEGITTLPELRHGVTRLSLMENLRPVPEEYIDPDVLAEGTCPTSRIGMHRWGLQHRVGYAATMEPELAYTQLLSRGEGRVQNDGIHFGGGRFASVELKESGLLHRAARKGAFTVPVFYDEMAGYKIRIEHPNGRGLMQIQNADPEVIERAASFREIALLNQHCNQATEAAEASGRSDRLRHALAFAEAVKASAQAARRADDGRSPTARRRVDLEARALEAQVDLAAQNQALAGAQMLESPEAEQATAERDEFDVALQRGDAALQSLRVQPQQPGARP